MNRFASARYLVLAVALILGPAIRGSAQLPDLGLGPITGGTVSTDFAALSKLFGSHTAFTAKLDLRIYDKTQKEKAGMPMAFARLDDKVRIELDVAQIKNEAMPSGSGALLKQINMDRINVILRPDLNASYVIFPGVQACLNQPTPKAAPAAADKKPKLETSALGKETIDGHACVKNKVVSTDDKGKATEYTVWNATDMKDFPVQILTKDKSDTVILRYKDIKLVKPDAKQFELPADCIQYTDAKDMMQAVMMKLATDAAAAGTPAATPEAEKDK